ncbi:MAG: glycosyltransferase [Lachnospiraceae bacterium]|nr:glycosyltransferase [Lachnospiraceae bacterium]
MDNRFKNFVLMPLNLLYQFDSELELRILFRLKCGYKLDLKSPVTYNEKLQWIKLYDHNELMPKCCDKFAVRQIVRELGCGEILNDLLWEGFRPEDIPFAELPDKFVIKVTHGSTFNIICTDKNRLNKEKAVQKCRKWLRTKFLPCYGEWFYGIEPPRIIVEKYIESDDGCQLRDYKVFCFNGEPVYIRVDSDRFTVHRDDVYTTEWERISGAHMGHGCSGYEFARPKCLPEMMDYARKLSAPFLHARIDFYIVKDAVIFGEITFTNGAGFDKFSSYEFDLEMGKQLELRGSKNGKSFCI